MKRPRFGASTSVRCNGKPLRTTVDVLKSMKLQPLQDVTADQARLIRALNAELLSLEKKGSKS